MEWHDSPDWVGADFCPARFSTDRGGHRRGGLYPASSFTPLRLFPTRTPRHCALYLGTWSTLRDYAWVPGWRVGQSVFWLAQSFLHRGPARTHTRFGSEAHPAGATTGVLGGPPHQRATDCIRAHQRGTPFPLAAPLFPSTVPRCRLVRILWLRLFGIRAGFYDARAWHDQHRGTRSLAWTDCRSLRRDWGVSRWHLE